MHSIARTSAEITEILYMCDGTTRNKLRKGWLLGMPLTVDYSGGV